MMRKGVVYDAGRVTVVNWRPDYSTALVRREMEIIQADLHCNAVRICAPDPGRLAEAASGALRQGLEAWFCPELWNKSPEATLRHIARSAAVAEELRARWPGQLVFSAGTELTLYMRGIERAATAAADLGNEHVGCEHLLLALGADPAAPAARLLAELGTDPVTLTRATRAATAAADYARAAALDEVQARLTTLDRQR